MDIKLTGKKYLVTSALPYVNNLPHLGTLICVLSADVYTRFLKLKGEKVISVLGTDEHGTTAEVKALKEKLTTRQLVNKYFKLQKEVYQWFNCEPDAFGRTSDKENFEITIDIFKKLDQEGYIVEDLLEQVYCNKCERFLSDRYVNGTCPYCKYEQAKGDQCEHCGKLLDAPELLNPTCAICEATPEIKKSPHLFIDLPKLSPKLKKWVKEQSIKGKWTHNAMTMTNAWLKEGLKKRCITRDLKWGIPVPKKGYENKVFYSWFDAPIGYISITKKSLSDWKKYWHDPKGTKLIQFMGKDNIPFHTILFPGSLIGSNDNYTLLDHISSNEYMNYEGGQFSKSRNEGVFGDDAKETGIKVDAWRYYLMVNRPEKADTDFSWEDFQSKINHELVANIGNLVNRTVKFLGRFYEGKVPLAKLTVEDKTFLKGVEIKEKGILKLMEEVKIKDSLREIMNLSKLGNQYFQENEPWKTIKENPIRAETSLNVLVNFIKDLGILINPFMPETSEKIFTQIGLNIDEIKFSNLSKTLLKEKHKIKPAEVLFEKLVDADREKFKEKFGTKTSGSDEQINEKEFAKLDLRVAKILAVEEPKEAERLYLLKLDFGKMGKRQIVSSIKEHYKPKDLVGKKIVVITNLKPIKMRGIESRGMLLAATIGRGQEEKLELLMPNKSVVGEKVFIDGTNNFKPEKEVTIKDFEKIRVNVEKGKALYNSKALKTSTETIKLLIGDGAIIN